MTPVDLLTAWQERAQKSSEVHYRISSRWIKWNTFMTIVVVLASAVVGSALFSRTGAGSGGPSEWALGIVSVVTAGVAGLQRALGLAEAAERHRGAGARWDEIFNRICILLTQFDRDSPSLKGDLVDVERRMSVLVKESPTIPQRWFEKVNLIATYERLGENGPA